MPGVGVPESAKDEVEATTPPSPKAAVNTAAVATLVPRAGPARCAPARRACLAAARVCRMGTTLPRASDIHKSTDTSPLRRASDRLLNSDILD